MAVLVWVSWERSLLKVLLGEVVVVSEYSNVVGAAGNQVGFCAAIWVDSDTPVWWDVSVVVVAAGLWVVWSGWSPTQDHFTDLRVLSVPWHRRSHSGWFLWERDVACSRGGKNGSIGKGVEVVEQPIDSEVGDDRAAPRTCIG